MPEKRAVSGDGAGPAAKKAALSSPTEELLGAVKSGDHDQVASLLSAGAPTTSADADGNAALWLACARVVAIKLDTGPNASVQSLLQAGADPNVANRWGVCVIRPLHCLTPQHPHPATLKLCTAVVLIKQDSEPAALAG